MRVSHIMFVISLVLSAALLGFTQPRYSVTSLGTLGGRHSTGRAINDSGQVAGFSTGVAGAYRAFFWSKNTGMLNLGLLHPTDFGSWAYGISNKGEVVGLSGESAFLWREGSGMIDLGNLGAAFAGATAINNREQVVGYSDVQPFGLHAFLWSRSSGMQDLGTLGGDSSFAAAINDAGQVVGQADVVNGAGTHAFIWSEKTGMEDLGTLGGPDSGATAISSKGVVVGFSSLADNTSAPFIWDKLHGMRRLGMIKGHYASAWGINASSQIVGQVLNEGGALWTNIHTLVNLNALMPHDEAYIGAAFAVNESGQITGTSIFSGETALLLTPVTDCLEDNGNPK
jgi:probable HAF family extracellular repeat protein